MPRTGFEPTLPVFERSKTMSLNVWALNSKPDTGSHGHQGSNFNMEKNYIMTSFLTFIFHKLLLLR